MLSFSFFFLFFFFGWGPKLWDSNPLKPEQTKSQNLLIKHQCPFAENYNDLHSLYL
jgi:hypothetical protein